MSKLNLPPIKRTTIQQQTIKAYPGVSPQQVAKLQRMGMIEESISEMVSHGVKSNIGDYLNTCRMAGIPASAFVEISKSKILQDPPDATTLKNYYSSLPLQPLLAMLAYRIGIDWKELPTLKNSPEFTQENLYAMLDLQGEKQ